MHCLIFNIRRTTLLLSLLITGFHAYSQQIPNGDFEQWTDFWKFLEPDSFITGNAIYFGNPVIANRETPGYSGEHALKIMTVNHNNAYVKGYARNSSSHLIRENEKIPTSLTGYYKCQMSGNDSAFISIHLEKFIGNTIETVGQGSLAFRGTVSSFTKFNIPIERITEPSYPTYYILDFQSTHYDIKTPSGENILIVDALAFDFVTALEKEQEANATKIMVNTDLHTLSVDHLGTGYKTIDLVDLNGKDILSHSTSASRVDLYYPNARSGVYLLKINHSETHKMQTYRIML